ncbi:CYTH and CHAD domain-containing protein [Ornithinimicrobium avium]|nr:CYTH and CHAD domain-containing protein [Ornithinimicrobium avium]
MRQVETERKFHLDPDDPLPALGDLVRVGPARELRMRAVYVDTRDLLLARNRITLRRREGGYDEGWHLKLPRPDGSRLEVHAPLGRGPGRLRVPTGHRTEVAAALGEAWPAGADAALLPVAVLRTHRVEIDLLDPVGSGGEDAAGAGPVLAQLCDDTVTALPRGSGWRELEVELVEGDDALLDRITEHLAGQGVEVADNPSKLARALGERPERAARGERPGADAPAAEVVLAHLSAQVAVILGREDDVRADAPDAVHKARVATRRLRSALRTFRRLLDPDVTEPLRAELRWYATALGRPRDAEVMRERMLTAIDELPVEQVVGPVPQRLRTELDARHDQAHAALAGVLDGDRYLLMTDRLVELLAEPPWRGRAHRPAQDVLPSLVAAAVERVRADRDVAARAEGAERVRLFHEARKKAKAVRYACEAVAPALGDGAAAAAQRWELVTEAFGEVQDSVVAEEWLRELGHVAAGAGEETYTYGVLVGREEARREERTLEAGEQLLDDALDHAWPPAR